MRVGPLSASWVIASSLEAVLITSRLDAATPSYNAVVNPGGLVGHSSRWQIEIEVLYYSALALCLPSSRDRNCLSRA